MSFQQGLSGLNAASKSLEAIGNNVANANTVGYKAGQAQFADVFANSLGGSGGSQVGIGVKTAGIAQQFTQGNITSTSNPLDIAINGDGFFRMSNNGTISYSRNGQFELDRYGYIVSPNGSRLTGNQANADGVLATGVPVELQITSDLRRQNPQITTEVLTSLNLDSRLKEPATTPFDAGDPTSYNNATSVTVYDIQGVPHVVQTYFARTDTGWDVYASNDGAAIGAAAANTVTTDVAGLNASFGAPQLGAIAAGTFSINGVSIGPIAEAVTDLDGDADVDAADQAVNIANAINAANAGVTATVVGGSVQLASASPIRIGMNGVAGSASVANNARDALAAQLGMADPSLIGTQAVTATKLGTLEFNNAGRLTNTNPITIPLTADINGVSTNYTIAVDYSGTTQWGSNFSVDKLDQDGHATGNLSSFSAGADGTIIGRYSNGETRTLGRIMLATFANPNGLQPLGDNCWAETVASGPGLPENPGSGKAGVLQSSAVEDSNIDLTAELVNMITAQRVYQANAQTIKTQDQVMQTLVNLR